MITVTKLNGQNLTINCELIQTIEKNPDTTITMTNGDKFITRDTVDEIIHKVITYKQKLYFINDRQPRWDA